MGAAPIDIMLYSVQPLELTADKKVRTTWIQVAKIGHWYSDKYGEFDITRTDLRQMFENFRAMVPPTQVPVDYDHLSTNVRQPGDGAAAGWYQDLQLRAGGEELWGQVEFTEPAADRIRKKEYRFLSPTFVRGWKDKATGRNVGTKLLCTALTNHPFIEGMAAIALSASAAAGSGGIAVPRRSPSNHGANMKTIKVKDKDGNEVEIPETAVTELDTVKSMQAKITELEAKAAKAPGDGQQVVEAAAMKTLTDSVQTLTTKVTELSTELSTTKTNQRKSDAEAKVKDLVRQGKIAADAETKTTFIELAMNAPDQFEKVTAKLKPIVALNQPHGSDDGGTGNEGNAIEEFNAKVDTAIKEAGGPTKLSKKDAIRQISLSNPDLANRYRLEMNQTPGAAGPVH